MLPCHQWKPAVHSLQNDFGSGGICDLDRAIQPHDHVKLGQARDQVEGLLVILGDTKGVGIGSIVPRRVRIRGRCVISMVRMRIHCLPIRLDARVIRESNERRRNGFRGKALARFFS